MTRGGEDDGEFGWGEDVDGGEIWDDGFGGFWRREFVGRDTPFGWYRGFLGRFFSDSGFVGPGDHIDCR